MATTQLTRQKVDTRTAISVDQSQKLVQTMLTMSFGCLAFLRGLFPDDSFVDQKFVPDKVDKNYDRNNCAQNNSIKIKTLARGRNSEVDVLLDWLEKAVFKSIRLKFLKALSLGIFLDENNPQEMIENYIFSFEYDNDEVKMNVTNKNTTGNRDDSISLLDSRRMAQQLMRRFIIITQSLEPLPQRKFLTMRLMFNENTDPEYQPPFFRDATFEKQATIKIPTTMEKEITEIGTLDTKIHKLSLNILSACDLKEGEQTIELNPFDLVTKKFTKVEKTEHHEVSHHEVSQTTSILGHLLESTQCSLQPTQAVVNHQSLTTGACECRETLSKSCTAFKTCRKCAKVVHGICYGNVGTQRIDQCIECLCGPEFNYSNTYFKDLMLLRKVYRQINRQKGLLPSALSDLFNNVTSNKRDDCESTERFQFCISALLFDGILVINVNNGIQGQTSQHKTNEQQVLVDYDNIWCPVNGKLTKNQLYHIKYFQIKSIPSCHRDIIPQSKTQVLLWIEEVKERRTQLNRYISDTLEMGQLSLKEHKETTYNVQAQEPHKRKNSDIADSMPIDTQEFYQELKDTPKPKKYRKISISKKTLRSMW